MPTITRLQHVAVTVPIDGLERARAFYSDVLGLREVARPPEIQSRPGIWYSFGSTELHIQAREHVPAQMTDYHPALVVDDIDAWRARFAAHDIEISDQPTIYNRRRFDVRDPFGNRIEIMTEGDAT
ncbi:MAG TPA: VOC family protein [Dehalococcoidia bacterium]|jgi:catechol 2,3-dioxygenase-like lactoylglutathione lyase family enzyme